MLQMSNIMNQSSRIDLYACILNMEEHLKAFWRIWCFARKCNKLDEPYT